jgi:hypothetical protein
LVLHVAADDAAVRTPGHGLVDEAVAHRGHHAGHQRRLQPPGEVGQRLALLGVRQVTPVHLDHVLGPQHQVVARVDGGTQVEVAPEDHVLGGVLRPGAAVAAPLHGHRVEGAGRPAVGRHGGEQRHQDDGGAGHHPPPALSRHRGQGGAGQRHPTRHQQRPSEPGQEGQWTADLGLGQRGDRDTSEGPPAPERLGQHEGGGQAHDPPAARRGHHRPEGEQGGLDEHGQHVAGRTELRHPEQPRAQEAHAGRRPHGRPGRGAPPLQQAGQQAGADQGQGPAAEGGQGGRQGQSGHHRAGQGPPPCPSGHGAGGPSRAARTT